MITYAAATFPIVTQVGFQERTVHLINKTTNSIAHCKPELLYFYIFLHRIKCYHQLGPIFSSLRRSQKFTFKCNNMF